MTILAGRIRVSDISYVDGVLTANVILADTLIPGPSPLPPGPGAELPAHFNTDEAVAWQMLQQTVAKHHLNAIAVQGHGQVICDALNEDWPGLGAYAHKVSDAVMWRDWGSIDVTVDSGRGNAAYPDGWYFRPDGKSAYGEGR